MSNGPRWVFTVTESFSIAGRGTVVVGHMQGNARNGEAAILEVAGTTRRIDRIGIDILCRPRGVGSVGLALPGVQRRDVPPGSVIYAIDARGKVAD